MRPGDEERHAQGVGVVTVEGGTNYGNYGVRPGSDCQYQYIVEGFRTMKALPVDSRGVPNDEGPKLPIGGDIRTTTYTEEAACVGMLGLHAWAAELDITS